MARGTPIPENSWRDRLHRLLHRRAADTPRDPAQLFAHFQAVLQANNRSLEVITDLGEKLGGDYLFDVNYTKTAYAELFSAISKSLEHFTILTGDNYPALAEILSRIDRQVRRVLTESGRESEPLVVFYSDISWDLAEAVGGKNYHLAMIGNELQVNIPKAFAITTRAFDLFLEYNNLTERRRILASDQNPTASLAELQRSVLAGTMPPDLHEELARAARIIAGRHGEKYLLAVRSSAEEEDGDFSFAGQFESVLNVPATAEYGLVARRRGEIH